ncbi:MAG: alkaline phosphatase family protein [Candidatus Binatia bacterium]
MLLVVGWDGACFELLSEFRAAGRMPVLDRLLERGKAWGVRSTVPAVTFPAWTSFLTGAEPAHHGITDFTIPRADGYGVRFVNATHRRLPTILARMAEAGLRVGMYGVPATFPPEGRCVFEICGFDTPLGATAGNRAAHPRELAAEVRRRHGRLGIEGIAQVRIDEGWHEKAHARLLDDIALRTRISVELLRDHPLDVFVVHFMEPDTASHHFWQFDDVASPRHRQGPRGVLADVYAALDRSLGDLMAAAGADPEVMVLSDHGSAGASDRIVFWNRWLADRGWLRFDEGATESLALRVKRRALSVLPAAMQARAFAAAGRFADGLESRSRFAGVDWNRTRVFSDEVPYFPSLRLNLAGRESKGLVTAGERDDVLERVTRDLLAARDPFDGEPVVERVRRREDLFDGPFASRYPDLILELRRPGGYAYTAGSSRSGLERDWMRRLHPEERSGAKGSTTSGTHSPLGIAVIAGPRLERGRCLEKVAKPPREPGVELRGGYSVAWPECSLPDLGVTVLALAGVAPSAAMQGVSVVANDDLRRVDDHDDESPRGGGEYSEDEEREVEGRLRALGYLP